MPSQPGPSNLAALRAALEDERLLRETSEGAAKAWQQLLELEKQSEMKVDTTKYPDGKEPTEGMLSELSRLLIGARKVDAP